MKYYIAENGQPTGPFEVNELFAHGLTGESLVWCESMTTWQAAGTVPELATALFMNASHGDEGAALDTGVWPEGQPAAPAEEGPQEPVAIDTPPEEPRQSPQPQQPQWAQQPPQSRWEQQQPQGQPQWQQQPQGQPQWQQPQGQPQWQQQPQGQPQWQQQPQGQPQWQQPQSPYPYQNPALLPNTWFTGALLVTIASALCCNPISLALAIITLIKSNEVKSFNAMGRVNDALTASRKARNWLIATVVTMVIGFIASMAYVAMLPDKVESIASTMSDQVDTTEVVMDDSIAGADTLPDSEF